MLKYVLFVSFLCAICAAQNSKPDLPVLASAQQADAAQKMAAQLESTHNSTSIDVQARLQQRQVANTAELKQHVDKAGMNVLSMEVIKKAQEIQRLAKSVQDKMKNAY